jgi:DNA polymerase-3 subunit delta
VKDKKNLVSYLESPPDFTVLVLIHYGSITNFSTEPFESLLRNNFLFEAKELKGDNLVNWLIEFVEAKGKILTSDNAQMLVDISGENRSMLESQLEKIFTFLGEKEK